MNGTYEINGTQVVVSGNGQATVLVRGAWKKLVRDGYLTADYETMPGIVRLFVTLRMEREARPVEVK